MSRKAGNSKTSPQEISRRLKISRSLRRYYSNKRKTTEFFESWVEHTYNKSFEEITHKWSPDKIKSTRQLWREHNAKLRKDSRLSFKQYVEAINFKSYDQLTKRWGIKKYTEERRLAIDSVAVFKYVKSKNKWRDTRTGKLYPRSTMAIMFKQIRRERMVEEIIRKEYEKTGKRLKVSTAKDMLERSLEKEGWFRTLWKLIKKSP